MCTGKGGRGSPCPASPPPGKVASGQALTLGPALRGDTSLRWAVCVFGLGAVPLPSTPGGHSHPPVRQRKCLQTLPSIPWGGGGRNPQSESRWRGRAQTCSEDQGHDTADLAFSAPGRVGAGVQLGPSAGPQHMAMGEGGCEPGGPTASPPSPGPGQGGGAAGLWLRAVGDRQRRDEGSGHGAWGACSWPWEPRVRAARAGRRPRGASLPLPPPPPPPPRRKPAPLCGRPLPRDAAPAPPGPTCSALLQMPVCPPIPSASLQGWPVSSNASAFRVWWPCRRPHGGATRGPSATRTHRGFPVTSVELGFPAGSGPHFRSSPAPGPLRAAGPGRTSGGAHLGHRAAAFAERPGDSKLQDPLQPPRGHSWGGPGHRRLPPPGGRGLGGAGVGAGVSVTPCRASGEAGREEPPRPHSEDVAAGDRGARFMLRPPRSRPAGTRPCRRPSVSSPPSTALPPRAATPPRGFGCAFAGGTAASHPHPRLFLPGGPRGQRVPGSPRWPFPAHGPHTCAQTIMGAPPPPSAPSSFRPLGRPS